MSEEKELHIDEGWKERVEREKEELKRASNANAAEQADENPSQADNVSNADSEPTTKSAATSPPTTPSPSTDTSHPTPKSEPTTPPPPPASFQFLIASLATQAMACLGQIPDDDGKPLPVNLPYAKHFIDLLGVIEDKTQNNLNEGEAAYLKGTLHQLRIQFVESSRK